MRFKRPILFVFILAATVVPAFPVPGSDDCGSQDVFGIRELEPPKTLDELLEAFRYGLIPDFNDDVQVDAFRLYLNLRFGNPHTLIATNAFEQVAEIQKRFPNLDKPGFASIDIHVPQVSYPKTRRLNKPLAQMNQLKSILMNPEANLVYWRKHLGRGLNDEQFQGAMETVFTLDMVKRLGSEYRTSLEKYSALFKRIQQIHRSPKNADQAVGTAQILADLSIVYGFDDPHIVAILRNGDGYEQVNAFRIAYFEKREQFAIHVGFRGGYEELRSSLNVSHITGWPNDSQVRSLFEQASQEVQRGKTQRPGQQRWTVRQMSFAESFFRSYVGGSCCASESYFNKAADPNFIFMTGTDDTHFSSGHVTLVLGTASFGTRLFNVAFVDKIQNIPNDQLMVRLEAIRQSALRNGFILSIPLDLGNHNGISNTDLTRFFIAHHLTTYTDQTTVLTGFTPHPNPYDAELDRGFSRAYMKLPIKPLLPLIDGDATFELKEVYKPWKTKHFEMGTMYEESIQLKHGHPWDPQIDFRNKGQYLFAMQAIEQSRSSAPDPQFHEVIASWVAAPDTPFRLKRLVLAYFLEAQNSQDHKSLYDQMVRLMSYLTPEQKRNLIQNWIDTPPISRYSDE